MVKVQLPSQLDVTTGEELTAEWENETHRGHLAKLRFYFFYHPQESWEAFDGPNFDDAQAFDSLFFFILPLFWCYWHNSCSTTQVVIFYFFIIIIFAFLLDFSFFVLFLWFIFLSSILFSVVVFCFFVFCFCFCLGKLSVVCSAFLSI